jgi:hypothetical protein
MLIYNSHQKFLPMGLADLTASVSLRSNRSIHIQLHKPLLTSFNARVGRRASARK